MRILFITSRFPYPPFKGDKVRAYYPIKLLSRTHDIDLLSFAEEGQEVSIEHLGEMQRYCKSIGIVPLNRNVFNAMLSLGVFSPWPSQVLCYQSKRMKKLIRRYVRTKQYDLVHIVCGRIVTYAKEIEDVPKVVDWIDSLSLSTERMYRAESFLPKKLLYFLEWKKMSRFERCYSDICDFSFVTSRVDYEYLDGRIDEIIPNGVDTEAFAPMNLKKDLDIIFTGNMSYFPNVKAVDFFCRKIFPIVRESNPSATFHVIGINPDKKVLQYHDGKNVFVTGFVPDLARMLNRAKIFAAPLTSGAGIQNKILEAMACSLPVVTTSFGNGGIEAKDGVEIIVRNDPRQFAQAVRGLLNDKKKRDILGRNGFTMVKKHFRWESIVDHLDEIYSYLLTSKCSSKQEH